MLVQDWSRIIAASVVPVVIISACGLLCLAFYNRLAAIVARLRTFQRERFQEQEYLTRHTGNANTDPVVLQSHHQFLEMLEVQTVHVTRRAHLIQRTLFCLLCTIGCLVIASLMLGLSVMLPRAILVAALMFVTGMLSMLGAITFAIRELGAALQPVELESRFVGDLAENVESTVAQTV